MNNANGGQNIFSNAVINPGTYLISVNDEGNIDFNEDTYSFCVNFTPNELELNQVWDEAAPIATDTCFEANIYGDNHTYTVFNDVDWFEVQVTEFGVLEVAVTSVPSNLDLDVGIYQYINNVLTLIADDRITNANIGQDVFSNAVIGSGTYLISVNEESNNDFNEETYTFCVNFTPNELELNQIWDEAAPIATDTCFEANIYGDNHTYTVFNDVDWFEVQVTEFGVLEVAVTSVPYNLDLDIGIYQYINNVLTLIADDRINNANIGQDVFSNAVVSPGTYLISVNDEYDDAYNEETYLFCVEFTANELELNQIYDEAAPIATDTCFEARIYGDNHLYTEFNDVDWFEVQVSEYGVLEVAVTSVPSNLDLNVGIYQIINNVLTLIANDRNTNANIGQDIFSNAVISPGTYLIVVEDEYNDAYNEETYLFCVEFTANELELNQIYDEAAPISNDTCFEARIYGDNHLYTEFNDVDWFEIQIDDDNTDIAIAVTSVPSNLDLNLAVYQVISNVLTLIADDGVTNANPGDDMFINTVLNIGTYLIVVEDEYNDAFNEETYHFCVSLLTDIDELSLSNQINIFPNPNNGQFSINLLSGKNDLKILEINIFDYQGRELAELQQNTFEGSEIFINLKNNASGLYVLKLLTNEGVLTKKILVH